MGQWYLQAIVICYSLSTFCSYTIVTYLSVNIPLMAHPIYWMALEGAGWRLLFNLVDLVLGVVSPRYSQLQLLYISSASRPRTRPGDYSNITVSSQMIQLVTDQWRDSTRVAAVRLLQHHKLDMSRKGGFRTSGESSGTQADLRPYWNF